MPFLMQQDGQELFLLGDDFMPWMVLAFGAALVAGNVMALIRPPRGAQEATAAAARDDKVRPPMLRTAVMIVVGLLAAAWGLASLLA